MWQSRLFFLIGCWVSLLAAAQLVPLLVAAIVGEQEAASGFLASIMICLLAGGSLYLGFRGSEQIKVPRLTMLLPVVAGVSLSFVAGLPFFFIFPDQGLVPAIFEGVSLITTTGATAYEGAFEGQLSVALWRAIAAWLGGFVAICMVLSILTAVNSGGLQLHRSPLPFGDSDVGYPRLRAVASSIAPLYSLITAICCVSLLLAGESFENAVMLAMSTVATAGITPSGASTINQLPVQIVLAFFMMLAALNWDIVYARMARMKVKHPYGAETRALVVVTGLGFLLLALLAFPLDAAGLWHSLFMAISAVSTTGFSPGNMGMSGGGDVPASIIFIVLACCGGAVASTSGGLKQLRFIILFLMGRREVDRLAHPHGVKAIHYQSFKVEKHDINAIWLIVGAFVLTLVGGSLLLAVMGIDFQASVAMAVSSLTLSGPLANFIDPYFAGFSGLREADYIILSILMLIGRVETTLFLAFFARSFWRG